MTIIRGATTISCDEKEEIQRAVKELLEQISSKNVLKRDEIMSIVFSSTSDIHSYYPAKAAREAGFEGSSLFSAQEPEIEGGLPLCIRVMLFVEKELHPIVHVYLHGAKALRKDIATNYCIAIDGPAGSGKSTVAKAIAKEYHILYLDTGAMYRACALKILDQNIDIHNESAVCAAVRELTVQIEYVDGAQRTILDGVDVSEEIRQPNISMAASIVSQYPAVRIMMVEKQRAVAATNSCVLDGRDIGTFVLPGADFKFFLTATPKVRAKRRYNELTQKGFQVDLKALEDEIILRDKQDSSRTFAPLKKAEDAIEIDTSNLTVEQVVTEMKRKMQEKI